jgi:GNAT superfamily N-acetyltransferase
MDREIGGDPLVFRFDAVDPTGDEATRAMQSYFAELDLRFPTGFDSSGALGPGAAPMGPPDGVFLVARSHDGTVAACGGLQRHDADTGEIKRMWVDPSSRGYGLGRRLLAELERRALDLGYTRIVLDTNSTLTTAIAMYESAGYSAIERYNDNPYAQRWFERYLS